MEMNQVPEPSEVFNARMKSAFLGQEVDWALRFADGHKPLRGYARLLFRNQPNDVKYVAVDVPLSNYPWLSSLRPGEPVQVRGRIAGVDNSSIELQDASLLQLT